MRKQEEEAKRKADKVKSPEPGSGSNSDAGKSNVKTPVKDTLKPPLPKLSIRRMSHTEIS